MIHLVLMLVLIRMICCELGDVSIDMHDFDATLVRRSFMDVVATVSAGPDLVNRASPNPLDIFHVFPPSSECHNTSCVDYHDNLEGNMVECAESLGIFQGFIPCLDLHYLYLQDLAKKIMWSNFFYYSFDFFKEFDLFRRALTIMHLLLFAWPHIHLSCTLRCLISSYEH